MGQSASHYYPMHAQKPQRTSSGGYRIDAFAAQFPVLRGMALSVLTLEQRGFREPHWHPNAGELSYCLEGNGLMTIFSPGNIHDTFSIEPGSLIFVPKGALHHIENRGKGPLRMALCFDHESPEELDLSQGTGVMPAHILASTCGVPLTTAQAFCQNPHDTFIGQLTAAAPASTFLVNRYKFPIEEKAPFLDTSGGTVKISNNFLFPTLDGLAAYSLVLRPKGAREPHWHTNAHELNILTKGSARITLLSPGGAVETFDMKAGDISFLPQSYFHYIENTGEEDALFMIYFNNSAPTDMGLSGAFGAYSNEILAAILGIDQHLLDSMPKAQEDLMVISGAG